MARLPSRDTIAAMLGSQVYYRARHRAAAISVAVGFLMLVLKMSAYLATGSTAILSDALESVVATAFMFFCFRLAAAPPDANHPYGHGKAEHLSIGVEGGMILLAALAIIGTAVMNLVHGQHQLVSIGVGLWLIVACALINLALGLYLLFIGRSTGSAILVADGQHVLSDVWTSSGVVASLVVMYVVKNEHWRVLIDSFTAMAIAVLIIVTAVKLLRHAVAGLLDEVDAAMLGKVVAAINEIRQPNWMDVHNLRLRSSGDITHIDFHMTVPGEWTIAQGHAVEEMLQAHILERLGSRGSVIIHFDFPHEGPLPPIPPGGMRAVIGGAGTMPPLTVEAAIRSTPSTANGTLSPWSGSSVLT